ncbi:RND family efflux transporter MFP subunit [Thioploca ingrica]|uniref:RND family efflux transporter MFP subunit n=1 Tax=Thioploca ingrica TaxID=40754 RepID=A0A090APM2_9GAMM|nr:RND family efflux transporter MFP subunit [Thioploca ingrica]
MDSKERCCDLKKGLLIMTVCLWSLATAQPPNPTGGPPALPVKTAPVKIGTVTDEITTIGTLRAEESVVIRSEIAGRVLSIHFAEGQQVSQGDELVTLDPAEYQAQREESAVAVKLNQLNFERVKDLYNKQLSSRQAYDEAQAKLEESRALQALDQVRLDKTVIHAPFDGILGLRQISSGAYIQPGQDLVNLAKTDSVKLDFRVSERFLPQIHLGQPVKITVDAYPNQTFIGKVYASEVTVDEETRTLLLRASLPNTSGELKPGMFARVALVLEERRHALLIPEQALVPQGKENLVFKIVEGKALQTKVTLGQRREGEVEILAGLSTKDQVVTDGQIKLRDGMPIVILPNAPSAGK